MESGVLEVLIADEEWIWKARRNFAEAARADSLVYYAENIVVPVDAVFQVGVFCGCFANDCNVL